MSEEPLAGAAGLSIGRASAVNTVAALVGKALSFLAMSVLVAVLFGVDARTDAFFLGALLPLWLQQSVAYGIQSCLLPVLGAAREGDVARLAGSFLRRVSPWFAVGVALLIVVTPYVVEGIAPGHIDHAAVAFARALLVIVVAGLPAAILAAMAYARRAFLAPALAQVATGAGLVAGLVLGPRAWGLWALVAGHGLGVVLQFSILVLLRREDARALVSAFRLRTASVEVALVLQRLFPVFLGAATYPVFLVATRWQAAAASDGGVTALELAARIGGALSGVVASAVAVSAVPRLAAAAARRDAVAAAVGASVRALSLALLPVGLTLAIVGRAVVEVVYHHGAFATSSADLVSRLLVPLAFVLMLEPVSGALVQLLFSRGETWRLLLCTTSGMLAGLGVLLPLAAAFGVEGVAWAIAVSQAGQVAALIATFVGRARSALFAALRAYGVVMACAVLPALALFAVKWPILVAAEARVLPGFGVCLTVIVAGIGFACLVWVSRRESVRASA